MGSSNRNVSFIRIPDGSGVRNVKKGIKYHIEKREQKETIIKIAKELLIAIGIIITCYLLHKVGYA